MTRLLILVTGVAGLAIVGRAAMYYQSVDAFAFAITCVMMAALVAGVVELWVRATRLAGLRTELDGVVRKAKDAPPKDLDGVSGGLRSLLRSHLEQDPMPTRAPLFTPYLVGLLVMLGLLGTFLGLFETLRGAREALSTSADVDALRAGLSQPMAGLMRSFGTSAAGVASSAMLGLGAVFARRAARELNQAVHHACAHGLAHLSAARRQLTALVALAEQGESLPAAAVALKEAVSELRAMRNDLKEQRAAQEKSSEAHAEKVASTIDRQLGAAVERFDAIDKTLADTQKSSLALVEAERERIAKRLAEEDARSEKVREAQGDAMEAHAGKVAAVVETQLGQAAAKLGALEATLRETQADSVAAMREQNEAAQERNAEQSQAAMARLDDAGTAFRGGLDAATEALRAGWKEIAGSFEGAQREGRDEFRGRADALLERIGALEAAWREGHEAATHEVRRIMVEGIAEASKAAGETVEPTVARIVDATERSAAAHLEALREQLAQEGEARGARDAEYLAALRTHMDAVHASLETARTQRSASDEAVMARLTTHLEKTLEVLDAATSARAASDAQVLQELRDHVQGLVSSEEARADVLRTQWADAAGQWEQVSARIGQRDQERAEVFATNAADVQAQLGLAAEAMLERLSAAEASDARQAERTVAMVEKLDETVSHLSQVAAQQTAGIDAFLSQAAERNANFEAEAQERLGSLMDALAKESGAQAERLAAFETALAKQQQEGAADLRTQLAQEAQELGQELARTGEMVRSAASLVQASGAELSAAAEMFSGAVEQHGEAAERWLSGLSIVERSVEEAGEEAAVEVLGQYLTRTHELFDQQLGFQQELFEQLKAARDAVNADA